MSTEGSALIIVTVLLTVSVALFLTKILILSRENRSLNDKINRLTSENSDLYWRKGRLESQVNELTSKINSNITVGAIFYTPNYGDYKDAFKGTKQKITSIDYQRNTFKTIDVNNGNEWVNQFNQITDFIWEKGPDLKHKFL